jgi:hypothetical protein
VSDHSHDFVDLEWFQEGWFFFQLHTPCHQDPIRPLLLVIAFINHRLHGDFPFFKTHRLFLLDSGSASSDFHRDVGMIAAHRITSRLCWHNLNLVAWTARLAFSPWEVKKQHSCPPNL